MSAVWIDGFTAYYGEHRSFPPPAPSGRTAPLLRAARSFRMLGLLEDAREVLAEARSLRRTRGG